MYSLEPEKDNAIVDLEKLIGKSIPAAIGLFD